MLNRLKLLLKINQKPIFSNRKTFNKKSPNFCKTKLENIKNEVRINKFSFQTQGRRRNTELFGINFCYLTGIQLIVLSSMKDVLHMLKSIAEFAVCFRSRDILDKFDADSEEFLKDGRGISYEEMGEIIHMVFTDFYSYREVSCKNQQYF